MKYLSTKPIRIFNHHSAYKIIFIRKQRGGHVEVKESRALSVCRGWQETKPAPDPK